MRQQLLHRAQEGLLQDQFVHRWGPGDQRPGSLGGESQLGQMPESGRIEMRLKLRLYTVHQLDRHELVDDHVAVLTNARRDLIDRCRSC